MSMMPAELVAGSCPKRASRSGSSVNDRAWCRTAKASIYGHEARKFFCGLEEAEGQNALVVERVDASTLADRIKQGPIPVDEVVPIAKQIAEALEAAHEAGCDSP